MAALPDTLLGGAFRPTPVSGHYRAVHFNAGDMCITDDNVRASRSNPADRIAERVYLVYLVFLRKLA